MKLQTRHIIDHAFSGMSFFSVFLLSASLIIILAPIFARGIGALVFKGTVEFRRLEFEQFNRGSKENLDRERAAIQPSREKLYRYLEAFQAQSDNGEIPLSRELKNDFKEINHHPQ